MELRKILEAVEKGDLSPDDAEKLIKIIFESDVWEEKASKSDSIVNTVVEIKEGEKVTKNLSLTNGKLVLKGELLGDVFAVNSDIELFGTLSGNLSCVRSKIFWKGGEVKGDLNAVMCKEFGNANVLGKRYIVSFNIPFANKIFSNNSFVFEDGNFDLGVISGKHNLDSLNREKVVINGRTNVENVKCEELFVNGQLSAKSISSEVINISKDGEINSDEIYAESVTNKGELNSKNLIMQSINNSGLIKVEKGVIESLDNEGVMLCETLEIESVSNSGRIETKHLSAQTISNQGEIFAELFEYESLSGNPVIKR
ncbi:MAG: hypothetical protein N2Z58_00775 [Fervidobacterium sp.]|nr:hypothetical protein [Fervidobacterium sp.]